MEKKKKRAEVLIVVVVLLLIAACWKVFHRADDGKPGTKFIYQDF